MTQPHPWRQVVRYSQYIPQCPYLKLVKSLVDRRFQQCLQLMYTILNLVRRIWGVWSAILLRSIDAGVYIGMADRGLFVRETKFPRWDLQETGL